MFFWLYSWVLHFTCTYFTEKIQTNEGAQKKKKHFPEFLSSSTKSNSGENLFHKIYFRSFKSDSWLLLFKRIMDWILENFWKSRIFFRLFWLSKSLKINVKIQKLYWFFNFLECRKTFIIPTSTRTKPLSTVTSCCPRSWPKWCPRHTWCQKRNGAT